MIPGFHRAVCDTAADFFEASAVRAGRISRRDEAKGIKCFRLETFN